MSDEATTAEIPMLKLQNGAPLFIANDKDIKNVIEECQKFGYPIFYVLGVLRKEVKRTANWSEYNDEPRIFKVTSNVIGYAVCEVDDADLGLVDIEAVAHFQLPKIPFELIQMIDAFFRKVDDDFGTESVILLSYDPRIGGHEGWGVLIPEQENTAASCKYDPQSVIDDKDDEVYIVGSAHSHPGMGAFASHTDHGDQFKNDGVHITFGWKNGSNFTDYHVELQMAGTAYDLPPHAAFIDAPELPSFPEVDKWMEKVKKKSYNNSPTKSTSSYGPGGAANSHRSSADVGFETYNIPADAPDPREDNVVIRLIDEDELTCPLCGDVFHDNAVERRRCWLCCSFLALSHESLDDLRRIRKEYKADDLPVRDLYPQSAGKDLIMWERWTKEDSTKIESEQIVLFRVTPGKVSAR